MMKRYIRVFDNHSDYENYLNSGDMLLPNVSHCVTQDDIHYNPLRDYSLDYLTFVSLVDNNDILFCYYNTNLYNVSKTISVSVDDGATWEEYESTSVNGGTTIATLNAGEKLLVKGMNSKYWERNGVQIVHSYFEMDNVNVEGNIMSLVYGDNFVGQTTLTEQMVFDGLFAGCGIVNAKNLVLPSTTLTDCCYQTMFANCENLVTAPQLPATTLAVRCYNGMFDGCTSLTTAPDLPATTLAQGCYEYMFVNCISLSKEAKLPNTYTPSNKLSGDYCGYMYDSTGLTYSETSSVYAELAYQHYSDMK